MGFKERQMARQNVAGSVSLGAAHESVMCEDVRRKSKLQWRPPLRDAGTMEYLLRKYAGIRYKQAKREAVWAKSSKSNRSRTT